MNLSKARFPGITALGSGPLSFLSPKVRRYLRTLNKESSPCWGFAL